MKKRKGRGLCRLYLGYTLDKTTLILLISAFALLVGILILIANPFLDKGVYLESYRDIHNYYFNEGLFIIAILNALIIAMLTIKLSLQAISFDALFISYMTRGKICREKLKAITIIILSITIVEVLALISVPTILYSRYKPNLYIINITLYLFSELLIEAMASIFIATVIRSMLMPFIVAFIDITLRIISASFSEVNKLISYLLPVIRVDDSKFFCKAFYFTPLWIIGLMLLYIGTYEIRDLKENI